MKPLIPSTKIILGKSTIPNAGRGVFTTEDIPKDTVIEQCPVIELPQKDYHLLTQTLLINYYFLWGEHQETVAICLGFGSLYNHSYEPNATYFKHPEDELINFVALRDIKKGEEITVNYNHGNQYDKSPLWMNDVPPPSK